MTAIQPPFFGAFETGQHHDAGLAGRSRTATQDMVNQPASATAAAAITVGEEVTEDTDAHGKSKQFPGFTPRDQNAPHTPYTHP